MAAAEKCAVSAVQATHESKLPYYGAVGGQLVPAAKAFTKSPASLEKPTPTEAEQKLIVPGLRAGHYLCFFGMHVLTPAVMELLEEENAAAGEGMLLFSTALARLAGRERYLACELQARRYDIGVKYGLLTAQLALALDGKDRDEVLGGLVELLARRDLKSELYRPCSRCQTSPRIITASDPAHARPIPRRRLRRALRSNELLAQCAGLEAFRRRSENLYERVRALFFLYAIHRFHLPAQAAMATRVHGRGFHSHPFRRLRAPAPPPVRGGHRPFPRRRSRPTARATPSPAPWRRPTIGWPSKRWPTRCGAASAPCAATNGCSAWATQRTSPCASARNCCGPIPATAPTRSCASARPCAWT